MSNSRAPPPVAVDDSMLMALAWCRVCQSRLFQTKLSDMLLAIDSSIATLDVQ